MKLLYFASLKTRVGLSQEEVAPPGTVATVADLIGWLKTRGPNYAEAFAVLKSVRAAVNQEHAPFETPVGQDDEVAFFPPVTGG